jgi:hypothetical protein
MEAPKQRPKRDSRLLHQVLAAVHGEYASSTLQGFCHYVTWRFSEEVPHSSNIGYLSYASFAISGLCSSGKVAKGDCCVLIRSSSMVRNATISVCKVNSGRL